MQHLMQIGACQFSGLVTRVGGLHLNIQAASALGMRNFMPPSGFTVHTGTCVSKVQTKSSRDVHVTVSQCKVL